jgi:hypothetical protein
MTRVLALGIRLGPYEILQAASREVKTLLAEKSSQSTVDSV